MCSKISFKMCERFFKDAHKDFLQRHFRKNIPTFQQFCPYLYSRAAQNFPRRSERHDNFGSRFLKTLLFLPIPFCNKRISVIR